MYFQTLKNGMLFYSQPFHRHTPEYNLTIEFNVEFTHANQGIMPETHNI